MIDRSVPKPDQDAGSYAAIQEARLLQSLGFHIVFIPDDFTYSPEYTKQLQEMGVEVLFSPYFLINYFFEIIARISDSLRMISSFPPNLTSTPPHFANKMRSPT